MIFNPVGSSGSPTAGHPFFQADKPAVEGWWFPAIRRLAERTES